MQSYYSPNETGVNLTKMGMIILLSNLKMDYIINIPMIALVKKL